MGAATMQYQALLDAVPNFRDVGGHPTADGSTVTRGIAFRSGQLNTLDDASEQDFAATGISTVFDLRTEAEMQAAPDQVPVGVKVVHLDVLADHEDAGPAQLGKLIAMAMTEGDHPLQTVEDLLGNGRAEQMMVSAYQSFVTLNSAKAAYREYFLELATGTGPSLFHCTAGKDRTGWAAASLLLFLGVDPEVVLSDYLASNEPTRKAFAPLVDYFTAQGGDANLILPMLQVRTSYLQGAIATMNSTFGSIDGYLTIGLGLDRDQLSRLRSRLLHA
ncbi:MAG: tyrosine-protein phosphatase [Actinomycetes bacterium]